MKKFVFSLEALYQFKQTLEGKQKSDLSKASAHLNALKQQELELKRAFDRCAKSLYEIFNQSSNVVQALREHANYFAHLGERKKELEQKILLAQKELERCREALVLTMRETKTLKKLKDEQFAQYLEEQRKEEQKEIGDIVSFKTITSD